MSSVLHQLHAVLPVLESEVNKMLSILGKDASVLRRLEFAADFFPRSMPHYWDTVALFSLKTKEGRNCLTPEQAHQFVDNIKMIDEGAFTSDLGLTKEIATMTKAGADVPFGVVLISDKKNRRKCGPHLYVRANRTSSVTVNDDSLRTFPGTHYVKYCRKRGCSSLQQHYGYYTEGSTGEMVFDENWSSLPYFMSTRETAISMKLLRMLDKEILIGQVSYKQRAEIYNDVHGYCGTSILEY